MGAILISIDLSILAAEPTRYDAYAGAIRKEFAHVPDAAYRTGRSDVLRRFDAQPVIFPDAAFARAFDRKARDNLARELVALERDGDNRTPLLRNLSEVGPTKPVGYLPLDTIANFVRLPPRAIAADAIDRGLAVAQFGPETCCIKSGALYVYDREALAKLLRAQARAVSDAGLPHDPDRFVAQIAAVWYAEEHPAYPIVASAFGERR